VASQPDLDVLQLAEQQQIEIVQLQFTDILGTMKSVSIPRRELERALQEGIVFDGSSIEGFVRIEESDMFLRPDPATYLRYPWQPSVARLLCDIVRPDGTPFDGCPRTALRHQLAKAADAGFTLRVGAEPEFFLFPIGPDGRAQAETSDQAGYFDLSPADAGERARADIVGQLSAMGVAVEAAHHEVAPAQHEIDFKELPALEAADLIATFRIVARIVAQKHGLHATFMPKPIFGINGSGLHLHLALWRGGENAFDDAAATDGLSQTARQFIAGVMAHARGMTLVANPLVNSYKRLQPGYEAPVHIAWSLSNRSPLVRVPDERGAHTRIEVRSPDPSCNPYLALTALLAAGLDGVRRRLEAPPPVPRDMYRLSREEQRELGIEELPKTLGAATRALRGDELVRAALGEHISRQILEAKEIEWQIYESQVHGWEIEQYLMSY
jgi:glutamine synthetase